METEIVSYIKEARQHGLTDQEIKQNLLDVGWEAEQVESSFGFVKLSDTSPAQISEIPDSPGPSHFAAQQPAVLEQPAQRPAQPATAQPMSPIAQKPAPAAETHPVAAVLPPNLTTVAQPPLQPKTQDLPPVAQRIMAASATLSDQHFEEPKKNKTWMFALIGLVVLVLLGAGGYFVYANLNPTPQKIWNNFLTAKSNNIASTTFAIIYTDPGVPDTSGTAKPFEFSVKSSDYIDATNTSTPVFSGDFDFGYKVLEQSGSIGVKAMYLDNTFYIDLSSITALVGSMGGQQISWVKFTQDDLKKLEAESPGGAPNQEQQDQLTKKLTADMKKFLKDKPIITATKLFGIESVSGQATYHLQNNFDKQQLKDFLKLIFDDEKAFATSTQNGDVDFDQALQMTNSAIDKIQVTAFETWIGKSDFKLYKFTLDLKFPALSALANSSLGGLNPLASAQAKSRDAKRLADMRQLASGLELYFNDHNGYPAGQNGVPQGMAPNYIGLVPTAPTPSDGDCSDYYNTYWYSPAGTPTTNNGLVVYPSYTYTFCFGQATGGYKPGLAKMTPSGIVDAQPCTGTAANCHKQQDTQQPNTATGPQPQGNLSMTFTYSDYNKKQNITAPQNATDLMDLVGGTLGQAQAMSEDAKRLADIRQLASAEELYFNDNNSYSNTLSELAPKYIGLVPTPPAAGGSCTEAQNAYSYTKLSVDYYKLTFCLGSATGGYGPGVHTLYPSGIDNNARPNVQ